jgi:hypothetical protein
MAETGARGLMPPCRWWDVATLGISRDVYHVAGEGHTLATRLTGVASVATKAAGIAAFVLFLRERRRNMAPGGGDPPPA